MTKTTELFSAPSLKVHVVEPGVAVRSGWLRCHIGKNVEFSTDQLGILLHRAMGTGRV